MVTWAEYNQNQSGTKQTVSTKTPKTKSNWDAFNAQMKNKAYTAESTSQNVVDPSLYKKLKEKGKSSKTITEDLKPEKTSLFQAVKDTAVKAVTSIPTQTALAGTSLLSKLSPTLQPFSKLTDTIQGTTTKQNVKTFAEGALRSVRGSTQVLATPFAAAFALPKGGATPAQAAKESLTMAKDVMLNKDVPIDKGVEDAAQMWLKNRGVGIYGGKDPDIADVAALGMLGFFNLFGDPAFEFGAGVKTAKALKEFATFKQVGKVAEELPKGTSFIKGAEIPREIKISEDLKVKIKPKDNQIVYEGYAKRFPTTKEGKLSQETADLVQATREATGMEMKGTFEGDNLILSPTKPIEKASEAVTQTTPKGIFESVAKEEPILKTIEPGMKESKLGTRMETDAIEAELVKNIPDLPQYETMNMKEQAQMATDLINSDMETVNKILDGVEPPPSGLRIGSLWVAMKKRAMDSGDIDLIQRLVRSEVPSQASAYGQEIKAFDEQRPTDPITVMRDISKVRAEKKGIKNPEVEIKKEAKREAAKLKREKTLVKKYEKDLNDFINSIQC